jgi:glutamine synthetase
MLELGTPLLPVLPKHGGDRNRTSPFAFTGNKFEFRALGSSMSLSLPNTVLNTIAAQAIDDLVDKLQALLDGGTSLSDAVLAVVKDAYAANKQVVFNGDGYSEDWHAEAAQRGLVNLPATPDALPWLTHEQTIEAFAKYNVLSERELDAREEVLTEQYVVKLNIEAETAASIARTQILPAVVRHLAELRAAGNETLISETEELLRELVFAVQKLESVNEIHDDDTIKQEARYMLETVIPQMQAVREVADKLERIVADDLWPLPKYWEMLFIK